jgi:hypothetical protein
MKRKIYLFFAIFLLLILLAGAFFTQTVWIFEAQDKQSGRKIIQLPFDPQDFFYLQTIHSVAKTRYTHIFKIDKKGNIILHGAVFQSGGGGFPVTGDGNFTLTEGKFHIDEMNRFIGILSFRVSPVSQETIRVSNIEIPLYQLVPEGTLIEIKIFRERLWFSKINSGMQGGQSK